MPQKSAILTYHSLDASQSVISTTTEEFENQMEALASSGIEVVSLGEVRRRPNTVALTFDDGFGNFATAAAPILERYRFPATVFVVSGYCGRNNQWPGQSSDVPVLALMDWNALRDLTTSGFEIGAHSVNHPDLTRLDPEAARLEMIQSRQQIEDKLGRDVTSFAYPYGRIPASIRPDCALACGTRLSYVREEDDLLTLPRVDAYYLRSGIRAGDLFSGKAGLYLGMRGIFRNLRQWLSQ